MNHPRDAVLGSVGKPLPGLLTKVAMLERQSEELTKQLEEASKKRWSLLPPVVGAVVSALLAALVAYFISRK